MKASVASHEAPLEGGKRLVIRVLMEVHVQRVKALLDAPHCRPQDIRCEQSTATEEIELVLRDRQEDSSGTGNK